MLSLGDRLLLLVFIFYRMLPHLDIEGRISGDPLLIKSKAFPLKTTWTVERIAEHLAELVSARNPTPARG